MKLSRDMIDPFLQQPSREEPSPEPLPAPEDAEPEAVRRFVARVLSLTGCRVNHHEDGTLEVALSRYWMRRWRCPLWVELSFDRAQRQRRPRSHLVVPGSPWLDDLIQWGREQGAVGGLFYPGALDARLVTQLGKAVKARTAHDTLSWTPRGGDDFAGALWQVGAANARLVPAGWSLVFQSQLLLAFRVKFLADDVRTVVVQTLIDPVTEESVSLPAGVRWSAFPFRGNGFPAMDSYRLQRLYRAARKALDRALQTPFHDFCRQVEARRRREESRLQQYFDQLALQVSEPLQRWVYHREKQQLRARFWGGAAVQGVLAPPAALQAVAEALERIEQERARRMEELDMRYRVRVQAELAYGAVVVIPRVEVSWRCTHPRRRSLVTFFDLLRGRWVDWRCELCQESLEGCNPAHVAILDDGTLACPRCWQPCAGCRKHLARGGCADRCHLCDGLLCDACAGLCPLGPVAMPLGVQWWSRGRVHPASSDALRVAYSGDHLKVCPACRRQVCSVCLGMASWGTHLAD